MIDGYYIKRIGQNRGAPRVWLDRQTERAGFEPGQRYDVVVQGRTVVLQANPDGSRVVSSKKDGEKTNPVIDLNSRELLALFDGMSSIRVAVQQGKIYLLPLASELKKQERFGRLREKLEAGDPLAVGSLSHGGGILSHAIHSGLKASGVENRLAFANEIREELLEHAAAHNDAWDENTVPFSAPLQELAFDERGVANIPKVEILEMGLPCSGESRAGKAKRGLSNGEAHPDVGHLVVGALIILSKANPAAVVFEQVPTYATSASANILRNQLRDMGYVCHERLLRGSEWGALEDRTRWCMVAVSEGIEFDFDQLQPPGRSQQKLGDVLENVPEDHPSWSAMAGLRAKEIRDRENGKNFAMQIFDPDSEHVGTITKGYAKVRSTDPKLRHPSDPNLLRQFLPSEHARIKGVPEHLVDGVSATVAHEILGQGVVYPPFVGVGKHLGESLESVVPGRRPARRSAVIVNDDDAPLSAEVRIAALAAEVVAELKKPNMQASTYYGRIVAADRDVFIMDVGRQSGIVLERDALDRAPKLGENVRVVCREGRAVVEAQVKPVQMALGL
ncbi:DNA cytosine methyltransferase [Cupriavidus nantongensis]|uniref:C-5 cytosine-specific DNA methylase n=1 Tax=Cupriavidus nantongensis TaxID=1796606 RepID=A0A142JIZ9_9BURK|nr:DNA cytosine methyltransferase [Cupriavidus nantongensis]AMR78061.1 C-5 cytosine-specific DNA methylase [Cupriavidus nantongensis]